MGFDCLLVAFMAATAVLGWLRRELVMLTAFTTGVLLICDAWFDILTAGLGRNLAVPMLTAALGNLPLAAIMITGAVRILRLTAIRLFFSTPRHRCGARLCCRNRAQVSSARRRKSHRYSI
jgi:hypothetical protein